MNEPPSTGVEDPKASKPRSCKIQWWLFAGLLIYLLITGKYSLLALIVGIIGDDWGGSIEIKERIIFLILGANLPLTLAAVVLCGIGLRKPPLKIRAVLRLFGCGVACVILSIVGDVLFGIDIY